MDLIGFAMVVGNGCHYRSCTVSVEKNSASDFEKQYNHRPRRYLRYSLFTIHFSGDHPYISEEKEVFPLKFSVLIRKGLVLLALLTLIYTLLMLAVTAIPNSMIQRNHDISMKVLEEEGSYPRYFFKSDASRLDNFTDVRMLDAAVTPEDHTLTYNSMFLLGRVQYWQGYLVFLKPLLFFFHLRQIRYLLYVAYFLLFSLVLTELTKRTSTDVVLAFAAAMVATNVLFTSVSLQFFSVYAVLYLSLWFYLRRKDRAFCTPVSLLLFFEAVGSVVCFLDFLTAPLLTLGIPLCVVLLTYPFRGEKPWLEKLSVMIGTSACWGVGYAMTFLLKWTVASILMGRNMYIVAFNQLFLRMNGTEELVPDRAEMLQSNVRLILGFRLFSATELTLAVICLAVLYGAAYLIRRRTVPAQPGAGKWDWSLAGCIALVGLYPYAWYIVFANHSEIHYWFTYRAQGITVFAVAYLLLSALRRANRGTPAFSGTSGTV